MATISNVNGKKITKIKYKGEIYDTGGSGDTNTLKTLLDATKSTYNLFYNYKGTSVDDLISYSDTENVTNMSSMFMSCVNLIKSPQINTISAKSMSQMFMSCSRLKTIDISHMNITSTSDSSSFASYCYSLTKLIIRNMLTIPTLASSSFNMCLHFTGTTDPVYNPQGLKDGRIYVPDDKVEALKTATNWSVYADIIVPLSTLVE